MPYDSQTHHRRSIRKRGYDYALPGWYFVTLCTEGKKHAFGCIIEWCMELNDAGRMVADVWKRLPLRFPTLIVDEFVVMPNHFHAIFQLAGAPPSPRSGQALVGARGGDNVGAPLVGALRKRAGTSPAPTVGQIVGTYKSLTANQYLQGGRQSAWLSMPEGLWQRNYYEHIIRNDRELEITRVYVRENPARWDTDQENIT